MKNKRAFLNLLLIVTISLSGCTQKQVAVQNPQLKSETKSAYQETSPEQVSKTVRSVSRVTGSEYSDTFGRMGSSGAEMAILKSRLRENPDDREAREKLAELCFAKGAYITALEHYKVLAVQLPDDTDIQLALAKTWRELRNYPYAFNHVKRTIELNPRSVEAYKLLGNLYLDKSDYVRAERAFLLGFQIDPNDVELLSAVGRTLVELEQAQEAQVFLEGALALDPEMQEAREALAVVKVLLGDRQGGLEQLMLLYRPAEAYSRLGSIYLEDERWTQAQGLFQRALELEPDLSAAVWNLSVAESYISPPSVVAIPAFGGTEMRLAWEPMEFGVGQEKTLALNDDLRLPALNNLHESFVDLPGFRSSALHVAGLQTPAPPDVLMDEGVGLWTDEVMSLPRDSRPGEEFLVFQPETKAHETDASEVHSEGNLRVASLSEPLPADQEHTTSLQGITPQDYLIFSEVYAVVTIPPFEEVPRADETPSEVAFVADEPPSSLAVHSFVELEAVDIGLQQAAAQESIEMGEALIPLTREIEAVSPTVVSSVMASESAFALDDGLRPLEPEQESSGFAQEVRQETVTQGVSYVDESDENGAFESRIIDFEALTELHGVSGENMKLYRAEAEPQALKARNSRLDFSFNVPEAKPGFPAGQHMDSLAPRISYSAEQDSGNEDTAGASVLSLDSDDFGDGGLLPEELGSQLVTVQLALTPVPGVSAIRPIRGDENTLAEIQPVQKAETETVAMTAPAGRVETSQSPGLDQIEAAPVERLARVEEPVGVLEAVTTEADETASGALLVGEDSTTQKGKLAGVAWAFFFAGLLSMFLAMGIHLSRRRPTRPSTSDT